MTLHIIYIAAVCDLQQFAEELNFRKVTPFLYSSVTKHQMFVAPRNGTSVVSRNALGQRSPRELAEDSVEQCRWARKPTR